MSLAYHPPVSSKAALGGDWWMNSKVMLAVDLQVDLQSRVGGRCGFGQISTSGFLAAVKLKWSLALFTFSATSCAQHCLSPGFSLSLSLSSGLCFFSKDPDGIVTDRQTPPPCPCPCPNLGLLSAGIEMLSAHNWPLDCALAPCGCIQRWCHLSHRHAFVDEGQLRQPNSS